MWKGHRRLPGEAKIIQEKAFSAIARSPWWVACRADSLQGKALLCWLLSHLCLCAVISSVVNWVHITDDANQSAIPMTRNIWTPWYQSDLTIMQILQSKYRSDQSDTKTASEKYCRKALYWYVSVTEILNSNLNSWYLKFWLSDFCLRWSDYGGF